MFDTIGVDIVFTDINQANSVKSRLNWLVNQDFETGEVYNSWHKGQLSGSWDSRICCQVWDTFMATPDSGGPPVPTPCEPYLRIELSLQKFLFGLNCFSYSVDFAKKGLYHLYDYLCTSFDVKLPPLLDWEVYRLDVGKVFTFADEMEAWHYLSLQQSKVFLRRERKELYLTGVMWVADSDSFKFYKKKEDFNEHDKSRIKRQFGIEFTNNIEKMISSSIRCERTCRKDFLKLKGIRTIRDIILFDDYEDWLEDAMKKLGSDKNGNAIVWTSVDAQKRINFYLKNTTKKHEISASSVYLVWQNICNFGAKQAKLLAGNDKKYQRARDVCRFAGITYTAMIKQDINEIEKRCNPQETSYLEFIPLFRETTKVLPFYEFLKAA